MKAKVEFFKNLIVIAAADGQIDKFELLHLSQKAEAIGITEKDFMRWISQADQLVLTIPVDRKEREDLLIEMISIALADGYFGEEEFAICDRLARTLNYEGLKSVLDNKINISHLKNLILIAQADGHIDEKEMDLLQNAASKIGIDSTFLDHLIENCKEQEYYIPQEDEEKELQLIQLLTISMADGELSLCEYTVCQRIAEKLGFSKRELDLILRLSYNKEIKHDDILKMA